MEEFKISCCICRYHLYCNIWDVVIGEEVECVREPLNESDRYAVAVTDDIIIKEHLERLLTVFR